MTGWRSLVCRRSAAGLAALSLLAVSLAPSAPADEQPAAPPPPLGVTVKSVPGARVVEAVLPGELRGFTLLADHERLALLTAGGTEAATETAPADVPSAGVAAQGHGAPTSVYLLDPRDAGSLRQVLGQLFPACDAIYALDDPADVLVGKPGAILSLGPLPAAAKEVWARHLIEHPAIDLRTQLRWQLLAPGAPQLFQPAVGRLLTLTRRDGGLALAGEAPLPVSVRRERTGLRLSSPPVARLERGDAPPLFAAGPVAHGRQRLATTLIDPAAPAGTDEAAQELWSLLPGPEEVDQSWYVLAGGRPLLIVATFSADQVGVFEKKTLRVFPLRADRTRAGARSILDLETSARRWHEIDVSVRDFDGDGHEDLVVVAPEGVFNSKDLKVELFPGNGRGGFAAKSRKVDLDAPDARWRWGDDVDGDGHADLAVVSGGAVRVYSGAPGGRGPVDKRPTFVLEPRQLGAAAEGDGALAGTPRTVDLGADGRHELVLWSRLADRTVFRLISLR